MGEGKEEEGREIEVSQQNGDNPRLDRIERILETVVNVQADMQAEHKALLTAQVLQGEEIRQLQKRTDEKFQKLADTQERMDAALAVLIATVDEIIRKPGASTPAPSA